MTLIVCNAPEESLSLPAMDDEPWQKRARAAGLTQKALAKLLGHAENTVSRQLRGHWESGIPKHIRFAIIAWENLDDEGRAKILAWADSAEAE